MQLTTPQHCTPHHIHIHIHQILWEMVSRQRPNDKSTSSPSIINNNPVRFPIPKKCDSTLKELMVDCLSYTPSKRPTFTAIVAVLKKLDAQYNPNTDNNNNNNSNTNNK